MKQVLLEITENGGYFHKDPNVIEEKKGLSNCFLNPDLSHLQGVPPAYYGIDEEGKIIRKEAPTKTGLVLGANKYSKDVLGELDKKLEDAHTNIASIYARIQRLEHTESLTNVSISKTKESLLSVNEKLKNLQVSRFVLEGKMQDYKSLVYLNIFLTLATIAVLISLRW